MTAYGQDRFHRLSQDSPSQDKHAIRTRFAVSRRTSLLILLPSFLLLLLLSLLFFVAENCSPTSPVTPVLCGSNHLASATLLFLLLFVAEIKPLPEVVALEHIAGAFHHPTLTIGI